MKIKKQSYSERKKRVRESIQRFKEAETIDELFFDYEIPFQIPLSSYLSFFRNEYRKETKQSGNLKQIPL